MILADKIIRLRKKNGWSQEELAEKMNVSRQAVSKWEAAQTTPDLEKILQLGNLFGVTTDYLLKDEIEDEEFTEGIDEAPVRKVTLAEANNYIEQRKEFLDKEPFEREYGVTGLARDRQKAYRSTYVKYNYIGACTCVLSPVPLLCGAFTEKELLTVILLCVTMLIAGIGAMFFIVAGVRWASMQKLLKEGEFSDKGKRKNKISETY